MTTGSAVETIAAVEGPTSRSPAKKAATPTTVDPSASTSSQSQPEGSMSSASDPLAAPATMQVVAAPVIASADTAIGSLSATRPSATRM